MTVDREKFVSPFSTGLSVLGNPEMPMIAVDFFTQLLSVPYAQAICNYQDPAITDLQLNQEKAEHLRGRLLSFLFASDVEIIEITYVFLAYLTQNSDVLLDALCGSFAPQFLPIGALAVIHHPSHAVKTAAFCILTRIIDHSNDLIRYVQSISQFVETMFTTLNDELNDIKAFCLFSAAFERSMILVKLLAEIPECQKKFSVRASLSNLQDFVNRIFAGKEDIENRLFQLLKAGALQLQSDEDVLSYVSILSSPFSHLPMQEKLI